MAIKIRQLKLLDGTETIYPKNLNLFFRLFFFNLKLEFSHRCSLIHFLTLSYDISTGHKRNKIALKLTSLELVLSSPFAHKLR